MRLRVASRCCEQQGLRCCHVQESAREDHEKRLAKKRKETRTSRPGGPNPKTIERNINTFSALSAKILFKHKVLCKTYNANYDLRQINSTYILGIEAN